MSVSARSLLIPAVATAGVIALTPSLMAPPAAPAAAPVPLPAVHTAEVQLAGIGRDIYDEITAFVQYTVTSAQYWIDLLPVIGPPLADQLGINYFDLIQPVIASTIYYISDLIENPLAFVQLTANYGANLYYAGYTWVSAQAEFIGFPPLPPIPGPPPLLAAAEAPAARSAALPGQRAAAAVAVAPASEPGVAAGADEVAVEAPAAAEAAEPAEPAAAAEAAEAAEPGVSRADRLTVRSARQAARAGAAPTAPDTAAGSGAPDTAAPRAQSRRAERSAAARSGADTRAAGAPSDDAADTGGDAAN